MWITKIKRLYGHQIFQVSVQKTGAYLLASFMFFDLFSPKLIARVIPMSEGPGIVIWDGIVSNSSGQIYTESFTMQAVITAYSSTADQTDSTPFITAANTRVRDGVIAANFLPIHSKVKIPELFDDKIFTVEDRMNRRYQNRIDIWFSTRAAALDFGMRNAEIIVVEGISDMPASSYGDLVMLTQK